MSTYTPDGLASLIIGKSCDDPQIMQWIDNMD